MKKFIRTLVTVPLLIIFINSNYGQYIPKVLQPDNQEIKNLAEKINDNGWVYFKRNLNIKPNEVFTDYPSAFGLSNFDKMELWKTSKDELGYIHYRFRQYYKGIPVEGTEYIVHTEQGIVRLCHGSIVESLDIDVKPNINEEKALEFALNFIRAEKYAWEDQDWEQFIKMDLKDSSATWFPTGELFITRTPGKDEYVPENYQLAYKFLIRTLSPDDNINIYINAKTGGLIKKLSNSLNATGTVETVYNGSRSFYTYYRSMPPLWDFILEDRTKPSRVDTRNYEYKKGYPDCEPKDFWNMSKIDDNDNYWGIGADKHAPTSHWAVQNAYKVFKDYFGRSYGIREESGYHIRVINDYYKSLSFDDGGGGDYIKIGKNLGTYSDGHEGSLDAIGHEFTHGVSLFSAGLDENAYDEESGPLMESFCDIFGEVIEYYTLGSTDWIMGTNLISEVKRSLQNPLVYDYYKCNWYQNEECDLVYYGYYYYQDYPISYLGSNWYPYTDGDGAHINCSVQNRWFYLLANGGTQNGVTVNGIGIYKAARITYYNLVNYIGINSTYPTSRDGAIDAAQVLYGECSPEYISTMNAWAAVNVGSPAPDPCIPPLSVYITGPIKLNYGQSGTWYAHPSGGTGSYNYEWFVDYGMGYYLGPQGYQSSFSEYMYTATDYLDLRVDVTSGEQEESAYHYVFCNNCFKGGMLKAFVYPNPSDDMITINVEEPETFTDDAISKNKKSDYLSGRSEQSNDEINYTLYNNFGQIVYVNNTNEKIIKINVSNLQKGHYILKIVHKEGVLTKQILIE